MKSLNLERRINEAKHALKRGLRIPYRNKNGVWEFKNFNKIVPVTITRLRR